MNNALLQALERSRAWRDGMRVPTRGEVAWLLPEGPKPYWRGEVTALRYE